jgi:hypothetical protein
MRLNARVGGSGV